MFIEDTGRKHYTIEEYKKITNYENTKKVLNDIKLDLPDVPDITDIGKFTLKRDAKILDEIIKPKDDLIKELYRDNLSLNGYVKNLTCLLKMKLLEILRKKLILLLMEKNKSNTKNI